MVPNAGIDNVETQPMFVPEAPIDFGSKEISIIHMMLKPGFTFISILHQEDCKNSDPPQEEKVDEVTVPKAWS